MIDPQNIDRPPRRLLDKLPGLELDNLIYSASVSAEAARTDRELLDRQVQMMNSEIREAIGEPVDIQATELFIKLNDGTWSYRTPGASSPVSMVYVHGLFQGLQVMDTIEVGLALPSNDDEYNRLILCAAVVPETSHADWECQLVPIKNIIRAVQVPTREL
jgi:hypothetical protein